jgi:tripartite ATP-independent transporter DctP family solute receptor
MRLRRLLSALAIMAATMSVAHSAEFTFKMGHNGSADHPFQDGLLTFKSMLEEGSNGRIEVQLFPGEQLGPEDKVNNLIRSGLVAGAATSVAGGIVPYVPIADALNFPFLFRDMDHFYKVMDGPVGAELAKEIEDKLDVVVLGWGFSGTRSVWNSVRPVSVPADLAGLKLRTLNSQVMVDTFNTLGAQVTPLAFGEVFNALQQGVIDGAETDNVDLMVEKFYENTKYVSLTNHLYLAAPYVFSKMVFDKLPPDLQALVVEAGKAAVAEERVAMQLKTDEARAFLEGEGIVFNDVDHDAFVAAVKPVYDASASSPEIAGYISRIQAE